MPKSQKVKGFRLPQRTRDELEMLVEDGIFRNATEAVIVAVEHIATQHGITEKLKDMKKSED